MNRIDNSYHILESLADPVVILDAEGRIFFVNSSFEEVTGFRRVDVVGKNPVEIGLLSAEDYERFKSRVFPELLSKGRVRNIGIPAFSSDGSKLYGLTSSSLLKDAEGYKIVVVVKDLSREMEMERKLSEIEYRYRRLFNDAPVAMVLTGADMTILDCNKAFLNFLGVNREEVVGKKWSDFNIFDDESLMRILNLFYGSTKSELNTLELRVRINGDDRWLETTSLLLNPGNKTLFITMLRDITDRVTSEKEVEMRLKQLNILNKIDARIIKGEDLKNAILSALKDLRDVVEFDYAAIFMTSYNLEVSYPDVGIRLTRKLVEGLVQNRGIGDEIFVENLKSAGTLSLLEVEMLKKGLKSYMAISLKVRGEEVGYLIIASKKGILEEDVTFIRNLASQLAIILHESLLFEQRKAALERIEDNIEKFAILVDHIRNPLAAIYGITITMVKDEKAEKMLVKQVERILETVRKLDEGWLKSEEIRKFLQKR